MTKEKKLTLFLKKQFFDLVVLGQKTIEVRLAYPSLSKIKAGVNLVFLCGNESQEVEVLRRAEYSTFEEMLETEDFKKMNPARTSKEEQLGSIRKIYSQEKEKRFGVVIFEIQKK
jgi:ASC-1-like (ASCH) protein